MGTEPPLLVRNAAAVLTGRPGAGARADGCEILVRDGVIAAIAPAITAPPGARVLDARDCVVHPGWVNTHHHLFQSLLKAMPAGLELTLTPWLGTIRDKWLHFDDDTLRLAATVGMLELMLSGCTTVADHHYVFLPDCDPEQVLFDVAAGLGVRFVLCRGGATRIRSVTGNPALPPDQPLDAVLAATADSVRRFHQTGPDPRRRVALAPASPLYSLHPHELRPAAEAARELGIRLHSHLAETVGDLEYCRDVHGMTPLQFMAEHGWVGKDVWFAHMVHPGPGDDRLLAATGTGIAHCPQSNARLGSGIAPVPELHRLGVPVSIGVDGAGSNEAADMAAELHACWLLHRGRAGSAARPRPEGGGESGAGAVSVETVVHWASAGGAWVLGLEDVGTLAVGQAADLVVQRLEDPRHMGLHDPGMAPVLCGARPAIRWSLVGGRIVVEDGRVPGVDMEELGHRARAAVRRMLA